MFSLNAKSVLLLRKNTKRINKQEQTAFKYLFIPLCSIQKIHKASRGKIFKSLKVEKGAKKRKTLLKQYPLYKIVYITFKLFSTCPIKSRNHLRQWMLSETACKANAFGMTYLGEIDDDDDDDDDDLPW